MLDHLLDYWYALEFFQPAWPVKEKEDIDLNKKALPWPPKDADPKTQQDANAKVQQGADAKAQQDANAKVQLSYDVYIGRGIAYDLIVWALERLGEKPDDSPIERDMSPVCMCALKVDGLGKYVAGSFAISSFVWALGCLVKAKNFGAKLKLEDLKELQKEFDEGFSDKKAPFTLDDLKAVFANVCKKINVESGELVDKKTNAIPLWGQRKKLSQKKDGSFPDLDPNTELMQSFYTKDITKVKKAPGKLIARYAESLHRRQSNRTMIDTDTAEMQKWLEAGRFPKGTWPSVHSPSLMQQLAINLAISGQPIFSVNGPPGTGKTTLLKEIVASNIVERAARMAEYANPDDAFTKCDFAVPPDQWNRSFYRPHDALTAFGMLVASNNNAAVENISIELPKAVGKDRSSRFTDTADLSNTYFSDIATALVGEPAWGLISARLGKKKNLDGLRSRLWFAKDGRTLKRYYDEPTAPDWDAARKAFRAAWDAVENERQQVAKAQGAPGRAPLESGRGRFGANFADAAFWRDIHNNEKSQTACPWTDKAYDTLREELFYRALMLHKAFVLGSNCVKQNLNRLFDLWDGRFGVEDREKSKGCLLNTLFFVVPVISTTFASVQTFLDDVQPGELGVLIVDESGQATPQSALGALWRTRRAIVVGDPLQVEPILTTPSELRKRFAEDHGLPTTYKIPELSVQMLADAQNPYGGERDVGDEKLWLGCPLVVHRRCIEPMFGISNRVAYEDRMFCKTQPPPPDRRFMLEASTWFDVAGEEIGNKNHTVESQVELVAALLEKEIAANGKLPDSMYIITPFVSIKRSLEAKLPALLSGKIDRAAVGDWLNGRCGTVHTFQGKEADEVLLVLGCDKQKGMGAAKWVGQKPNIINVAVSRAKYRLGVIGSYDLWRGIKYVDVVCDMLQGAVVKGAAVPLASATSGASAAGLDAAGLGDPKDGAPNGTPPSGEPSEAAWQQDGGGTGSLKRHS
jgi:hypothetical protein